MRKMLHIVLACMSLLFSQSVVAQQLQPRIRITPRVVDFGEFTDRTISLIRQVTITNDGSSTLRITKVEVIGPQLRNFANTTVPVFVCIPEDCDCRGTPRGHPFKIAQLPIEIPAGQSLTFFVPFNQKIKDNIFAAGSGIDYLGALQIETNDPLEPVTSITLRANWRRVCFSITADLIVKLVQVLQGQAESDPSLDINQDDAVNIADLILLIQLLNSIGRPSTVPR